MKRMIFLAAVVAACAYRPAAADPQSHTVAIQDFAYKPDPVTVSVGDTVVFANHDPVGHTVTAKDGSFDSKNIESGKSWSYTFSTAGTYAYFCSVHPSMQGTITAQ